jgi:hypothetical protein
MSGVSPLEEQEIALVKFDHTTIPVSNWIASRDWYVNVLGLKVEFEVPDRLTGAVALPVPICWAGCSLK